MSVSLGFGDVCLDFSAGHCGEVIYSCLLVLFCPEELRLAVLDALLLKHSWSWMPQQTQMSVQPWTCRTVSAPWA